MTDKQKRDKAVKRFAQQMIKKLDKKAKEGFKGWDNPECNSSIKAGLFRHLLEYSTKSNPNQQLVDIANYAMMLDYQARQRGVL